jgi:hypothetical protein
MKWTLHVRASSGSDYVFCVPRTHWPPMQVHTVSSFPTNHFRFPREPVSDKYWAMPSFREINPACILTWSKVNKWVLRLIVM